MKHTRPLQESEISEIIARCTAGETEPFNQIVNRYRHVLWFYILKFTRDKELAKDLTQETFIKVFKGLQAGQFDGKHALSTWMFRIGHNIVIDYQRAHWKEKGVVSLNDAELFDSNGDQYTELANRIAIDQESAIEKIIRREEYEFDPQLLLDELSESDRTMITLRYFSQFTYEEIASFMEKPLGTIKATIHRSKAKLLELAKKRHVLSQSERLRA